MGNEVALLSRSEWLEARKKGIGASEAAAVCGMSQYRTPVEIWLIKTGQMQDEEGDNDDTYWGKRLEGLVLDEYQVRTGANIAQRQAFLRSPEHPFMVATLDAIAIHEKGGARAVEAKSARFPREWGPADTDEAPVAYIFQAQHQMAVSGLSQCDIAVLIGGRDYRIYPIARDEKIIEAMIEVEREFWQCVVEGRPPPMRKPSDAALLYPKNVRGKTIEADEQTFSAYREFRELKEEIATAQTKLALSETRIKGFMGDAEILSFQGETIATWKKTKDVMRVNREKLEQQYPDVAAVVIEATPGSRRFHTKEERE